MGKLNEIIASTFVRCTGYTYSNMARLFIRLFVGVMPYADRKSVV